MASIKVQVQSQKEKRDLHIDSTASIEEFRNLVSAEFKAPPKQLYLIHAGKILRDSDTVENCGIHEESIVRVVIKKTTEEGQQSAADSTSSGTMGSAGGMPGLGAMGDLGATGGLGGSPTEMLHEMLSNRDMIRSLFQSQFMQKIMSNPDFMRQIMAMNPQMKEMIDRNHELQEMMRSPQFLQQMSTLMSNPEMMQSIMRGQEGLVREMTQNPESVSGLMQLCGIQDLEQASQTRSLMQGTSPSSPNQPPASSSQIPSMLTPSAVSQPSAGSQATAPSRPSTTSTQTLPAGTQATLSGEPSVTSGIRAATDEALSAPQQQHFVSPGIASSSLAEQLKSPEFKQLMADPCIIEGVRRIQLLCGGSIPAELQGDESEECEDTSQETSLQTLQEKFSPQLEQLLQLMGFNDKEANEQALTATRGDVTGAIYKLLQM